MENCQSNIAVSRQRGFTLIELMVTIAIVGILVSYSVGNWGAVREDRLAESAAQEVRSLMYAARVRAISTGVTQYVGVDFAADQIISTTMGGSYDKPSTTWTGSWKPYKIDLIASNFAGVVSTSPTSRTFFFTNRGTATSASLVSRISATSKKYVLTVNGVTGRVRMVEQ